MVVLSFLREAEAVACSSPFPPELLERLRELVPCDGANFCELDLRRHRLIADTYSTGERFEDDHEDKGQQAYWRLRQRHPICAYQDRTGDFSARMLSDFVTRRELHRLEIYTEWLGPGGIEAQLVVGLPAPPWHTKVFLFHSGGADFRERDRLLLDLLQPHLVHLYESAKSRRVAAALAAGAEAAGELVVLDSRDAIAFATARAHRLMHHYCGHGRGARLPALVEEWACHDRRRLNGGSLPPPGRPLTIERDGRRLVVTRLNGEDRALLLTEEAAGAAGSKPLSWRQWQVLTLVEAGRSNAEIATALCISPGTARTHLEHIYAKLGVHSRTAAVARARGLAGVATEFGGTGTR